MICDICKWAKHEGASMDYPYPMIYCAYGHWEGDDPSEPEPEVDPWKDCKDFEENR